MAVQKVFKVGNSRAITLPVEIAKRQGFEVGTEVTLKPVEGGVLVQPAKKKPISAEFERWLRTTGEKYHDVLKELARL